MEPTWLLQFKIYYYNNGNKIFFGFLKNEETTESMFWIDFDIIMGTYDYYKSIKKNFFDKYNTECKSDKVDYYYTVISCHKNFDTKKFPTLYIYNSDYNYTFELTQNDLFEVRGNRKYFLIVFCATANYPWKFGRIFLQKYLFNFDIESKSIGFYRPLDEKKKNLNFILFSIFWIIILILTAICCFCLGKYLYNKRRKKRNNEIDFDEDHKYLQMIQIKENKKLVD